MPRRRKCHQQRTAIKLYHLPVHAAEHSAVARIASASDMELLLLLEQYRSIPQNFVSVRVARCDSSRRRFYGNSIRFRFAQSTTTYAMYAAVHSAPTHCNIIFQNDYYSTVLGVDSLHNGVEYIDSSIPFGSDKSPVAVGTCASRTVYFIDNHDGNNAVSRPAGIKSIKFDHRL